MWARRSQLLALGGVLVSALVGCGGREEVTDQAPPAPSPELASTRVAVPSRELRLRRPTAAATAYADPRSSPPTPLTRDLRRRIDHPGAPGLHRLAELVARLGPDATEAAAVDTLSAWAGYAGAPPRIRLSTITTQCQDARSEPCRSTINEALAHVQPFPRASAVGVASHVEGGETRIAFAIAKRLAGLEPFPVAPAVGERFAVRGRLAAPLRDPRIVIAGRGEGREAPAGTKDRVRATIECDAEGEHRLELTAIGALGPTVVFNVSIYCGGAPPEAVTLAIDDDDRPLPPTEVARASLELVNGERQSVGLASLRWDDDAAAVALAHSVDMAARGQLGHLSPASGDVVARFHATGQRPSVLRENVGVGPGPLSLHQALMHSPVHRRNILAHDISTLGVGVHADNGRLWITQNFVRR